MNYTGNQEQFKQADSCAPKLLEISQNSPINSNPVSEASLPCLNSIICTENPLTTSIGTNKLSTNHKKSAFILGESVRIFCDTHKITHTGFLTLTFPITLRDPKLAQKRLHSFMTNVLTPRYKNHISVFERQESGSIHYHFLISLAQDIKTGINFEQLEKRNYKTANKYLKAEWKFLREIAPNYGFGRTELLPVKTNEQAMAKYIGKYIAKHVEVREYQDKGIKLVRYSDGARIGNNRFNFISEGSKLWRQKLRQFAVVVEDHVPHAIINSPLDFKKYLGPSWAYKNRDYILNIELDK
tara:strand:+ start:271 stop:1164 length:894 start_codon:yes stop_codon:yes gene_type:complete